MDGELSDGSCPPSLFAALRPLLPSPLRGAVIALVGAGGKTSALFRLADELAAAGHDVLLTTTTHIADPRREAGRTFDALILAPDYRAPVLAGEALPPLAMPAPAVAGHGRRVVLAADEAATPGKLRGIHPSHCDALRRDWPFVIVEADGAARKPLKAPAAHEPVLPAGADLVVGLIGLRCLGRPLNGSTVHRPERFGALTGCAQEAPIRIEHLAALAALPEGLFKDAPAGARRVLLLNQADVCADEPAALAQRLRTLAPDCADRILVGALGAAT